MLAASVNLATQRATVDYLPGQVGRAEIMAAIQRAGYGVLEPEAGQLEDSEEAAQRAELRDQQRKSLVGAIFAFPLFALNVGRDLGWPGHWAHAPWGNWLRLALAVPVQ